jgi:Family of unknown function (DUF6515)
MKTPQFIRRLPICLTLLLGATLALPQTASAGRFGSFNRPAGSVNGDRVSPNLQNRSIDNPINQQNINNRNVNTINRHNNVNTINGHNNVNISGNEVNVSRGWYGRGYYTPPGWGVATFGTGLAIGAALNAPPPNYTTVVVSGTEYYYADGVYVQPRNGAYIVAAPPIGAIVNTLPEGCSTTTSNGVQSFDCSGVIYQPYSQNGSIVYRVVSVTSN